MNAERIKPVCNGILGALVVLGATVTPAAAQTDHDHMLMVHRPVTLEEKARESALIASVRAATARFKDPIAAQNEGYGLLFGCVSGGDLGAMGMHFVNPSLVFDGGELDATRPEIVLYEPLPNGKLRITGADFLVIASDWDAKHPGNPPQLMGQLFHYFESPNRFGLPPFYTLHVWAWKDNPNGTFTNWNPNVSCDAFNGQQN
jgi:hypothetical protein